MASTEGCYSSEESNSADAVLNYIGQILMTEGLENGACMFSVSALQASEKSLYDVLGEKYPSSITQTPSFCNCYGCKNIVSANNAGKSSLVCDFCQKKSCCVLAPPVEYTYLSSSSFSLPSFSPPSNFANTARGQGLVDPPPYTPLVPGSVSDSKTWGLLPHGKRDHSASRLIELKKNHRSYQLECGPRERNKHLAVYNEVHDEPSEMFDEVLLFNSEDESAVSNPQASQIGRGKGSNCKATRRTERVNKKDLVDLRTLLMHCAEAVGNNDLKGANEVLLQIRLHASPFGDGSQRLAHCFANALKARLAGTGSELYAALAAKKTSSIHMLKAHSLFLSACPFMKIINFFTSQMIMDRAEKSTRLHIIHFGILNGFQWPGLIQRLSKRPGGPPLLRITGIDIPQPGFQPASMVEETGRRLAIYCERFKVPFEYNAIAQKWETIQVDDLKINKDEVIVVNSLYRFRYLFDEKVVVSSPRDTVLNLIKRINPDLFIHGVVNGAYNSPFFTSRFREALYNYSAAFDMFDANASREDQERMVFEQEIYGKEVLNVIACEGAERVERPEVYKQWQLRNMRAGLRQLPLNQKIFNKMKDQVRLCYHKDFLVDEDSQWLVQGWKGRILSALSCWKVA
ncbi:scarecrow-like protein 14 [Castanea sativa]|uniref:scarecrow-like protein 14 n=1 Tax=Castanea sativa TaxID=21020 RepID=UPI003F64B38E